MSGESPSTKPMILDRQRIGVIGLGYVGLTEAVEFARADIILVPPTRIANANLWVKQHIVDLPPFRLAPPIP
jgi:hypothetical protein